MEDATIYNFNLSAFFREQRTYDGAVRMRKFLKDVKDKTYEQCKNRTITLYEAATFLAMTPLSDDLLDEIYPVLVGFSCNHPYVAKAIMTMIDCRQSIASVMPNPDECTIDQWFEEADQCLATITDNEIFAFMEIMCFVMLRILDWDDDFGPSDVAKDMPLIAPTLLDLSWPDAHIHIH